MNNGHSKTLGDSIFSSTPFLSMGTATDAECVVRTSGDGASTQKPLSDLRLTRSKQTEVTKRAQTSTSLKHVTTTEVNVFSSKDLQQIGYTYYLRLTSPEVGGACMKLVPHCKSIVPSIRDRRLRELQLSKQSRTFKILSFWMPSSSRCALWLRMIFIARATTTVSQPAFTPFVRDQRL